MQQLQMPGKLGQAVAEQQTVHAAETVTEGRQQQVLVLCAVATQQPSVLVVNLSENAEGQEGGGCTLMTSQKMGGVTGCK